MTESETLWAPTPTFVMFRRPAAVIRCEDRSDGCCLGCGLCWEWSHFGGPVWVWLICKISLSKLDQFVAHPPCSCPFSLFIISAQRFWFCAMTGVFIQSPLAPPFLWVAGVCAAIQGIVSAWIERFQCKKWIRKSWFHFVPCYKKNNTKQEWHNHANVTSTQSHVLALKKLFSLYCMFLQPHLCINVMSICCITCWRS